MENIDYNRFWQLLITSGAYKKLRAAASQSLPTNTLYTEFIALFSDAKAGYPNTEIIQRYINVLFFNFEFTSDEVEELQSFMEETNLNIQYTLPDEKFLSTCSYDSESNKILNKSPFGSWIIVNGNWEAPVPYPTDGKIYNWNEDFGDWVEH